MFSFTFLHSIIWCKRRKTCYNVPKEAEAFSNAEKKKMLPRLRKHIIQPIH